MSKRTSKQATASKQATSDKRAASKQATSDKRDEPTTTTDEPTPEPTDGGDTTTTTEPTPERADADCVDAFRAAVTTAIDSATVDGSDVTIDPAALASATSTLAAVRKRDRDRVRADVVAAAVADAFGSGDVERAQASSVLGSALAAAASAAPTGTGPTPADVVGARVDALAALAADVVGDALARFVPNAGDDVTGDSDTVVTTLASALGVDPSDARGRADAIRSLVALAEHGTDTDTDTAATWARAFGGRTPDASATPGRRTGGAGGGGRSAGRSLSNVPDGDVTYRHGGTDHTATVDGDAIVTADGERHTSPSGAATHVNGGTSVNGWTAWKRDGTSLAKLHDA